MSGGLRPLSSQGARLLLGQVMHARLRPRTHRFSYPVFFLALDVEHLPASRWWLGINRPGLVSFQAKNHGDGSGDLAGWVRQVLQQCGLPQPDGAIELHCFPRVLGYHFKPVSFWYCHDANGELRTVLAEVNNTFADRHTYVLRRADGAAIDAGSTLEISKILHVSPFCRVTGHYRFRFAGENGQRTVLLDYFDEQGLVLATALRGRASPLSMRALLGAFVHHPWQSLAISVRIHWHALLLYLKRVPWYSRPDAPDKELSS